MKEDTDFKKRYAKLVKIAEGKFNNLNRDKQKANANRFDELLDDETANLLGGDNLRDQTDSESLQSSSSSTGKTSVISRILTKSTSDLINIEKDDGRHGNSARNNARSDHGHRSGKSSKKSSAKNSASNSRTSVHDIFGSYAITQNVTSPHRKMAGKLSVSHSGSPRLGRSRRSSKDLVEDSQHQDVNRQKTYGNKCSNLSVVDILTPAGDDSFNIASLPGSVKGSHKNIHKDDKELFA